MPGQGAPSLRRHLELLARPLPARAEGKAPAIFHSLRSALQAINPLGSPEPRLSPGQLTCGFAPSLPQLRFHQNQPHSAQQRERGQRRVPGGAAERQRLLQTGGAILTLSQRQTSPAQPCRFK